ncbi:MAG: DNA polymerase III subunit delta [Oscillospiraceae bacterium]|nr:DNA polymerase III subunit delta [Oscillospiraceae bacterium]
MADFKKKEKNNDAYKRLVSDLKSGTLAPLYALYGEERYLLENVLGRMRATVAKGTEEFNYKRLEGKSLTMDDLQEAVDAMPVFSDRVFVEVQDYDMSRLTEETRADLIRILSDIPEYTTVAFVFPGDDMKLDGRAKSSAQLKNLFTQVDFNQQESGDLIKWVMKHAKDVGKTIDRPTADHLIFVTDGLMTTMTGEIEKLGAYCTGEAITKADIDAIVTPTLEADLWGLLDAIADGNIRLAAEKMNGMLENNESASGIIYTISQRLRQLASTRAMLDSGATMQEIQSALGVKDYPAKKLVGAARKLSLKLWRRDLKASLDAAYKLNSNYRREKEILAELIARLGA